MTSTIDRTKPEANSPAASAEMRGQFGAAADDIEALQSGKEDAGTADAAVAAHDASGAAHGGVEAAYGVHAAAGNPHADSASLTDLSNHKSGGTGEHPAFTNAQDGFAPASGGGTINFLRADGTWAAPPGGGGGGGIGAGTPFAVGELMEVSSAAGDGEAISSGLTAATLNGHIGDGSIHFTEGSITHNNVGGRSTADAHPTSAITGLDTALAGKAELAGATFTGNVDTSGSATISELGVNILQPGEIIDGSATITPDLSAGTSPWIVATTTGAFTLNPPTSGIGSGVVQVEGASSITAGAGWTLKTNDPPATPGPAFGFYTRRANGDTMLSWTNGT